MESGLEEKEGTICLCRFTSPTKHNAKSAFRQSPQSQAEQKPRPWLQVVAGTRPAWARLTLPLVQQE